MDESARSSAIIPSRCWWAIGLRASSRWVFGILAFAWPGITVEAILMFFGAFVFFDGLFTIVSAFVHREWPLWWAFLLEGLIGLIVGGIALFNPAAAIAAFVLVVAAWSFITGIFEIIASLSLPGGFPGKWGLLVGGVLSILLGILISMHPGAFTVMIAWLMGGYAVLFGAVLIYLSYTLKCAA